MMDQNMDDTAVAKALRALCDALRADGTDAPEDGFRGFYGLSTDQRLLLAMLDRAAQNDPSKPRNDAAGPVSDSAAPPFTDIHPEPTTKPDTPAKENRDEPVDTGADATPSDVLPQVAVTLSGATAEDATTITADEAPAVIPVVIAADAVEPDLALIPSDTGPETDPTDAKGEGILPAPPVQTQTQRAEQEATAPVSPPMTKEVAASVQHQSTQQSLISAAVKEPTEIPQPGGVPTIPTRATLQGDAAVLPLEIVKKSVYLKNARVKEDYSGPVDVAGLRSIRLVHDGGTGLLLDEQTATLRGTLMASGDFTIRLQGLISGRRCDVVANLAVIPDPKSLWVAKDSDRTAPFWKPDEDSGLSRGDLLCVAASKRGRSHAQEALFRDDDFRLWTGAPGGWNVGVVADGAGSAKFSRRGSQIAVSTIVNELPPLLEEHLTGQIDGLVAELQNGVDGAEARIRAQLYLALAAAAFNAAKAISEEATKIGEGASAFSTTLVISVARKGPRGWFIAGFSIGDGGAAIFDLPTRTVVPLTLADSGEFAGQTRFLHKSEFAGGYENVAKRLFFDVRDEFTAILAMTDGITDPKFPTDTAFANPDIWCDFWETDLAQAVLLSRDNPGLERELLAWLDFWSPGNHDDRTLAIMLP